MTDTDRGSDATPDTDRGGDATPDTDPNAARGGEDGDAPEGQAFETDEQQDELAEDQSALLPDAEAD